MLKYLVIGILVILLIVLVKYFLLKRKKNQVSFNGQNALEGGYNPTDFELNLLSL